MGKPGRLDEQQGRHALVDGIPFQMPVYCRESPALMAVFSINADKARQLIPGNEIHPFRLWNKGLLVITVIDYRNTNIGKYIEYSIAIACTHGSKPAPRLLPGLFMKHFGTGQWVVDLPVSTGIWGMPKHQANLDFKITDKQVSSQYDLDGMLGTKIEIDRPDAWLPFSAGAVNYCGFRGMLMKSNIYFKGKVGLSLFKRGSARFIIGDHPRVQVLKSLEIEPDPVATAFIPSATGTLDDHFEGWFLSFAQPPAASPEGLESVAGLGRGEDWLPPPRPIAE